MNVLLARNYKQHFYFSLSFRACLAVSFVPLPWIYIFSWQRSHKEMVEHPFLPGISNRGQGPLGVQPTLCCSLQPRFQRLPFFSIHGRNEKAEQARKRTRGLLTSSPPSTSVMIVQCVSISQSWAQSFKLGPLLQKPTEAPFALE